MAEPRRIAILELVRDQEMLAGEIAKYFEVTRTAISQHISVLVDAVRCCSLGQITEALFEVGGKYRRNM